MQTTAPIPVFTGMTILYDNELYLYKNFFQPVMKLVEKIRTKGKIHRKYDKPKAPCQRVIESDLIDEKTKLELQKIYAQLNNVIPVKTGTSRIEKKN